MCPDSDAAFSSSVVSLANAKQVVILLAMIRRAEQCF